MEKRQMCRICLVENVRMYVVTNKDMQDLYEKLADIPVSKSSLIHYYNIGMEYVRIVAGGVL